MLLQAFDFLKLYEKHACELQIGGSDQWGNITAGIDLIRKKLGKPAYGLTLPLITNADGTKFGKTEAGAIWLDPKRTSVYKFYQFWINTDDRDIIRYLKYFSIHSPKEQIDDLEAKHEQNPGAREAHRALANEMTQLIHGKEAAGNAWIASAVLFGETDPAKENDPEFFKLILGEVSTTEIKKTKFGGAGMPLIEILVQVGLSSSKGQARKDIEGGGIYINNNREANFQRDVTLRDLLCGEYLLLRKGKKNYAAVIAK
jgi:tyrosyl-tRNA synthetase